MYSVYESDINPLSVAVFHPAFGPESPLDR